MTIVWWKYYFILKYRYIRLHYIIYISQIIIYFINTTMENINNLWDQLIFDQDTKLINEHEKDYAYLLESLLNNNADSKLLQSNRLTRRLKGVTLFSILSKEKLNSDNIEDFTKFIQTLSYNISKKWIFKISIWWFLLDEIELWSTDWINNIGLYWVPEVTNDEIWCIWDSERDRDSLLLKIVIQNKTWQTDITLNEYLILGMYLNDKNKNNISKLGDKFKDKCKKLLG